MKSSFFLPPKSNISHDKVIVIGGGLAGCSAAYELAKRQCKVTVIEREAKIAKLSSGNPCAVFMPLVTGRDDILGQIYMQGFETLIENLQCLDNVDYSQSGVLELRKIKTSKDIKKTCINADHIQKISHDDACEIAGIKILKKHNALYFPKAGHLKPKSLCKGYLEAYPDYINKIYNHQAIRLKKEREVWQVIEQDGTIIDSAPSVIIANANDAMMFEQTSWIPTQKIRGQLSFIRNMPKINCSICCESYIAPMSGDSYCVGATYNKDQIETLRQFEHNINLGLLSRYIDTTKAEIFGGRVAFRCTSPDRRALVGSVPDIDKLLSMKDDIYNGRIRSSFGSEVYLEGLFISTGHGSRGLTSTAIASELLAKIICSEGCSADEKQLSALAPIRFPIRNIKAGK